MVKSRAGKRGEGGLVQAGEIPLVKTLAKKYKAPSRAQLELVDAALAIQSEPDAAERAFIARQLVLCTLPHSDPGDNAPRWLRRTGNSSLVIQPGWDGDKDQSIGYPYGTIPRLLLFWAITEAVRTKSRRLILGRSTMSLSAPLASTRTPGEGSEATANA